MMISVPCHKIEILHTSSKRSTFTSRKRSAPKACALIFPPQLLEPPSSRTESSFQIYLTVSSRHNFHECASIQMSPPVETFPASELAQRVQLTLQGRRRKGREIVLSDCELREMVQYSCHLEEDSEKPRTAIVKCEPIVRLFRK